MAGADFSGATLSAATSIIAADFSGAFYSLTSTFNMPGFDPVAAGMLLVPERRTADLLCLGLVGIATVRRRCVAPS